MLAVGAKHNLFGPRPKFCRSLAHYSCWACGVVQREGEQHMSTIELDRLKAFVGFAEQVCTHSGNGDDARRHINHLISRAEEDIKTKNLEIQMHLLITI